MLTDAQITQYHKDGFIVPNYRLPAETLASLSHDVDRFIGDDIERRQFVPTMFDYDERFIDYAFNPDLLDMIEQLAGPDFALWNMSLFGKPARDGKKVPWHQDGEYWPIRPVATCTVWIAIDDATRENGCVRFIPGSQDFGLVDWEHLPYMLTEDVLAREVDVPLHAGDATFHHSMTLHCSGPNTTPHRRRGWSLHYVSADTRYIGTPEETERIKNIGCLVGPEPTNGWPLIRGREFPGCV